MTRKHANENLVAGLTDEFLNEHAGGKEEAPAAEPARVTRDPQKPAMQRRPLNAALIPDQMKALQEARPPGGPRDEAWHLDRDKDVDELAVVDKAACRDSRPSLVATFPTSAIDSKESRGLGMENNDPTTG